MSTTTIRLPEELRERVDRLAAARGSSAHSFMVEAVTRAAEEEERRQDFEAEAARRVAAYRRTGEYYEVDEVRNYLLARARGEDPPQPTLHKDPTVAKAKRRS